MKLFAVISRYASLYLQARITFHSHTTYTHPVTQTTCNPNAVEIQYYINCCGIIFCYIHTQQASYTYLHFSAYFNIFSTASKLKPVLCVHSKNISLQVILGNFCCILRGHFIMIALLWTLIVHWEDYNISSWYIQESVIAWSQGWPELLILLTIIPTCDGPTQSSEKLTHFWTWSNYFLHSEL